jgi:D-alanyl-lipoteichoic acid acyltransferase DltB (MBOAT superfamily)
MTGIIFFSFQIYCDFSGYSDIARGASKVMGIDLMENFRQPYLSTSIHEFWQRWHISLSTWFRDYVYIPLGGNRKGTVRWLLNLIIVFLISGLWHGASWNFIIWGGIHGTFALAYAYLFFKKNAPLKKITIPPFLGWSLTFAIVTVAWIFFRSTSLSYAFIIIQHLFQGWATLFHSTNPLSLFFLDYTLSSWLLSVTLILLLLMIERIERKKSIISYVCSLRNWKRYSLYYSCLLILYFLGVYKQSSFIYFQF